MQSHRCCLLASFLVAMSLEATAATWTVNKHGPADFTEIKDAVAAASDGDVILVTNAGYQPFVIDGKGLTIVGTGIANVVNVFGSTPPGLGTTVTIRNLAAHQRCVIESLALTSFEVSEASMKIVDCAGPVWVQHLFVDTYNALSLSIERSASVSLHDCFLQTNTAAAAPDGTPQPKPGLRVVDSRVTVVSSTAKGSHGVTSGMGLPAATSPPTGGAGCEIVDSVVDFQDCDIDGGSGNSLFNGGCSSGGDGGPGIVVSTAGGSSPVVTLRGTAVSGGFGGFHQSGCGPTPSNGAATLVLAGTLTTLPAPARVVTGVGYALGGAKYSLSFSGAASEQVVLFAGLPNVAIPLGVNTIHLTTPMVFLGIVPLSGSGKATVEFVPPVTAPGAPVAVIGLQGFFASQSGTLIASGPLGIAVD